MNTQFSHKTRIWISNDYWKDTLTKILDFTQITVDFFETKQPPNSGNDFIIFTGLNGKMAEEIQPNIVFLSSDNTLETAHKIIPNIATGGVLIYPENKLTIEEILNKSNAFFRRINFPIPSYTIQNTEYYIDTIFGVFLLHESFHKKVKDFIGLQILCQQMGIMEDVFLETVSAF